MINFNTFIKKSVPTCANAILITLMICNNTLAETEYKTYKTSAYRNHWGRSSIRSFLNNGLSKDNTDYLSDSTKNSDNTSGYASYFSKEEYDLIEPFTYLTNIVNTKGEATACYECTDRIWLPTYNRRNDCLCISFMQIDPSMTDHGFDCSTPETPEETLASNYTWQRSSGFFPFYSRFVKIDNKNSNSMETTAYNNLLAAFQINISEIEFASIVPPANQENDFTEIGIDEDLKWGKDSPNISKLNPMYIRKSDSSNSLPTISNTDTNNKNELKITLNKNPSNENTFLVLQTIDKSEDGKHHCYYKTLKISNDNLNISINENSLIKVWVESTDNKSHITIASKPTTIDKTINKNLNKNFIQRGFALKDELNTSWGTSAKNWSDASNQIIAFGRYKEMEEEKPIKFWIANRETSKNKTILTLYQASIIKTIPFTETQENYEGKNPDIILKLKNNLKIRYNKKNIEFPREHITFKQKSKEDEYENANETNSNILKDELDKLKFFEKSNPLPKENLKWQYRTPRTNKLTEGTPKEPGTYEIRCYADENDYYYKTYSPLVTLNIYKPKTQYKTPELTPLQIPLNSKLSEIIDSNQLESMLDKPIVTETNEKVPGTWKWINEEMIIDQEDTNFLTAQFIPESPDEFDWEDIENWNNQTNTIDVKIPIQVIKTEDKPDNPNNSINTEDKSDNPNNSINTEDKSDEFDNPKNNKSNISKTTKNINTGDKYFDLFNFFDRIIKYIKSFFNSKIK